MSLRDDIALYTELSGNDGNHTPIGIIGAYLDGYEKGKVNAQPEIVRCKDCKHWKRQTNYQGAPLSFGFCESEDMWGSLYGETYEVSHIDTNDDFYCGYAERREK